MLVDTGPLGLGLDSAVDRGRAEHAREHVLDLGHVGHDVLDQDEGDRVVDLTLALLPQDLLVASATWKSPVILQCTIGGANFFKKIQKFENRHVDLDRKTNSKTILQNTFFEILSCFLRK
jgi:hypothetical protein